MSSENVQHFNSLPNVTVLEILRKSHIVLMPSFGETYGYAVLEGMATGCVPIVTNISALREFASESNSFIIDLKLITKRDENGILDVDNPMPDKITYCENSMAIEEGVYNYLNEALLDRRMLELKSFNALETIRKQHNPINAIAKLEQIYSEFKKC
jgi:glycosyltransferase involved in cell wall biosynthesis